MAERRDARNTEGRESYNCRKSRLMRARLFKSGNSQVVRIPNELRFEPPAEEVEIERVGDGLVIRPTSITTSTESPAVSPNIL